VTEKILPSEETVFTQQQKMETLFLGFVEGKFEISDLQFLADNNLTSQEIINEIVFDFLNWCAKKLTEECQKVIDEYPDFSQLGDIRMLKLKLKLYKKMFEEEVNKYSLRKKYEGLSPQAEIVNKAFRILSCNSFSMEKDSSTLRQSLH
jgi:hypothetical protein